MKALLVYPAHLPQTYWSFSGALPYIERRAALPPLSLVTLAAMLPEHWDLRLIDMNVAPLRDADLLWAAFETSRSEIEETMETGLANRLSRPSRGYITMGMGSMQAVMAPKDPLLLPAIRNRAAEIASDPKSLISKILFRRQKTAEIFQSKCSLSKN